MNSQLPAVSTAVRIVFALLVATSALLLLNHAQSGPIQKLQDPPGSKTNPIERKPSRRLFESRIPEHLPIKLKIKLEKERKFRDLANDNWAREFELEVKNIGDKPIYHLWFYLEVPEAKIADSHQGFTIMYGRMELADLNNRPTPGDVPILPGETKVLTLEDVGIRGWDAARARGLVPRIHGVRVIIQYLSFGDGTGFFGKTGAPRPKPDNQPKGAARRPPTDRYGGLSMTRVADRLSDIEDLRNSPFAGIFRPAFFSRLKSTDPVTPCAAKSASAALECNCINASCWYGTARQINTNETNEFCYQCGNITQFQATQCTQPGSCFFREVIQRHCSNAAGEFYCPVDILSECAEAPPSPSDCPGNAPNPDCKCVKFGEVYDWDCSSNCGPGTFPADYNAYPQREGAQDMRQDKAKVIAASAATQVTIVRLTVSGMITSAIALPITHSLAEGAFRLTPLALTPLSVVPALPAIRRRSDVCPLQHQRRHLPPISILAAKERYRTAKIH